MYLIYESYIDETRNMKELRFNTKIIGLYNDKKNAETEFKKHLSGIVDNMETDYNWYIKKYNKKIIKKENKNIIDIYEVFNDELDNIYEMFYVILEKIEMLDDKESVNNE